MYYLLPLTRPPQLSFAHAHFTSTKRWRLGRMPGLVEIVYIQKGALIFRMGEKIMEAPAGSVVFLHHDEEMTVENPTGDHAHITVAFELQSVLPVAKIPAETEGLGAVVSPLLEGGSYLDVVADIRRIITVADQPLEAAAWIMMLLSDLTAVTKKEAQVENPLCLRAKKLIAELQQERADYALTDVADRLEVSYGYLSRLFKAEEGMTLTEYSNRRRLERVKEILYASDMTLEEAGHSAGFEDVKYVSRLFRKTYGITAREYIRSVRARRSQNG